jgi:hypothetical protein
MATKAQYPNYYEWEPLGLNSGAPMPLKNGFQSDGTGNVFYSNSSNLITRSYSMGYENITGINPVKSGSPFIYTNTGLVYIGSDSRVRNLTYGSSWSSPLLGSSVAAARGDALIFAQTDLIFFTSLTGIICSAQRVSGVWSSTSTGVTAKANCSFAFGDSKLYFIDPSTGKMKNMAFNGSIWYDSGFMNNSAPLPRGDAMTFGNPGELFYVDVNNNIT